MKKELRKSEGKMGQKGQVKRATERTRATVQNSRRDALEHDEIPKSKTQLPKDYLARADGQHG